MKKHIRAAALAVSLLLLAGCGTARSQSEPIPAAEQTNTEQTLGGLHLAQSTQGDAGIWIVSGDQAFLTGERQVDGGYLLQSVDLTTGQRTVLCKKAGCAHSDRGCDAWLRSDAFLQMTETESGSLALFWQLDGEAAVELRDQSGKVLRSQTKIPALPVSGPVYRDGSSLYYMSSAEQYQNLWQVNVEDSEQFGQCEEVCRWQLGGNPYPLLCTEDGIVVERTSGTGEEENQGTTCLYLLRWDNAVQKIFEQDLAQGMIWKAEGDTALFVYQRASGMLEQINPADGTLTKFAQVQPGIRYANPVNMTQNRLIYGWNDGEAHGQSWVEQNGQPVEIKALSRSHNGSVTDAIVLQVLGNGRLLADLGELEYPITETGTDGKVFSMNTSERLYGIFTLDEYCQSGKEYLSVQTEAEF
ncbi:hypothetical protein [Fournierella massiliensis]|uniref:hypothetical protein n=1 Tax=Allofournierella massiliensis TaxID=1650663 RepID=UPI0035213440